MRKTIFAFILGVLVSGGIVYAATLLDSKDVTYTPEDSNFDVSNVESALDNLYEGISDLEIVDFEVLTYLNNTPVTKKANFIIHSVQTTVNGEYSYPIVNGVAQNEKVAQMFRNEGTMSNCVTLLKVDINPGDVVTWGGLTGKYGQAISLYIK